MCIKIRYRLSVEAPGFSPAKNVILMNRL